MRACATASVLLLGLTLGAASMAACSSGTTTTQVPAGEGPSNSPTVRSQATETALPATAARPPAAPQKAPETAADCKEMLSEITNDPPEGGVVMNNAMTAGDAGSSDRLYSILEVIKMKRDSFRCCFDVYARKHPGAKGRLALQIKLDPQGKFLETKIKPDESDITAPEVESCMSDLVQSMSWPKSPSGKETLYTHRFDFKPRT
ncbi:AgmX/PglI C-terminal domain-containing protein [Chondromyces crocatus]|uniref:AgmX/PglI C-terminal domain-containing protein n=1 Tax=Chondromyces crocatus TaxID=52 RepID=A0A0K1ENQ5_CHOCO|nr:AgmX/PglI C-terminal domain-containing protein [Chondromyces crocatus]AKT42277.1 uncharacterized protein CMC5_065000 [Chondromyces crocatus]